MWSALQRPWSLVKTTVRLFGEINAEQRAAAFAYYAVFSLVPLIALLLSVGSVFFNAQEVHEAIGQFIPASSDFHEIIWNMVHDLERSRGGIGLASFLIFGWSSLRFFQALVRAVNRAWHTHELPWWQTPLKNLIMLAVIASGLAFGILVPALAQGVAHALESLEQSLSTAVPHLLLAPLLTVLNWTRYLVGGAVLFYTILMLYKLAPRRQVLFRQVWFPALLVTVVLQLWQIAVVAYLPRFVHYNTVYGTIGGLMLLLFWIYLSGMIIIGGGCLCAAIAHVGDDTAPAATPTTGGN